jgi:hypothetical protein
MTKQMNLLNDLFLAAKSLRDSGYDGPFMGDVTEDLFNAIAAIEVANSKTDLVYQLDCCYANGKPVDSLTGYAYLWISTKSHWDNNHSFPKESSKDKLPYGLRAALQESSPSWFYFCGTNKELQDLMYEYGITERT